MLMLLMHRGQPSVFLLLLVLIGQVTMLRAQHRPIALPQGELPALPQTDGAGGAVEASHVEDPPLLGGSKLDNLLQGVARGAQRFAASTALPGAEI